MPFMKKDKNGNSVRDYKRENELYNSKPEQRANRSKRTIARNQAIKDGRVSRGDNLDLDHIKPLSKGGSNAKSNTRVVSASENRSFARNKDSSLKSQRSKKGK